MTLRSFALLLMILSAPVYALAHRTQTAVPADPKASDGARSVLNYLANLPNQDRKRVVSGQMVFSSGKSDFPDWWNDVVQQTGSAPGLMHADILLADPWVVNEGNIDFSGSSALPEAAPTQH